MKYFYKIETPFKHNELGNIVFVAANDIQEAVNILKDIGIEAHEIKSIEFLGQGYIKTDEFTIKL